MTRHRVHLLDVGVEQYGDCVLVESGALTILIDGAHTGDASGKGDHPSIPAQLRNLLGLAADATIRVSLLVVSHAHNDHVGCLPVLVERGVLKADWALVADPHLAWGEAQGENTAAPDLTDAGLLQAALREELSTRFASDAEFRAFASDAASLKLRYRNMITQLEQDGTRVLRFVGHDSAAAPVAELEQAFAALGLKLLGPSETTVLRCGELISRIGRDAAGMVAKVLHDAPGQSLLQQYLRAIHAQPGGDAVDASGSVGPAINMTSIVMALQIGAHKLLFTGDAQLEEPEISFPEADEEIFSQLLRIRAAGPYAFAKIGHHGSHNAFGKVLLKAMGNPTFLGLCTGERSQYHPAKATLKLLQERAGELTWARTDVNRLTSFDLAQADIQVAPGQGQLNDSRPPLGADPAFAPPAPAAPMAGFEARPVTAPRAVGASAVPGPAVTPVTGGSDQLIELNIERLSLKIPVGATLRIELSSNGSTMVSQRIGGPAGESSVSDQPGLQIAAGRALPPLAVLTDSARLAAQIGRSETNEILAAVRAHPALQLVDLATGALVPRQISDQLWSALRRSVQGVLILGGYEVIPAESVDCLPPELRAALGVQANEDEDGFVVWSDSVYGDSSHDGFADVPISRIPDGASAALVRRALAAGARVINKTHGVRNHRRPFADSVYRQSLRSPLSMPASKHTTCESDEARLSGDAIYLMLHGHYIDPSRFWGEDTPNGIEATNMGNIGDVDGAVVMAGCCWGALVVRDPASRTSTRHSATLTPAGSLALGFLERGARAFVGCTGTHYSPGKAPWDFFGKPMHDAFWSACMNGRAPAEALFHAKMRYIEGFPHGRRDPLEIAIEYKILAQFTCLGLGW